MNEVLDALTVLVKLIVDMPEAVDVEVVTAHEAITYRVSLPASEMGKIIGKQGRTAHSLRVILGAIAKTRGQTLQLDIVEGPTDRISVPTLRS